MKIDFSHLTRDDGRTDVAPHIWKPRSRWLHRKICRHCYLPKSAHPVMGWVEARPLTDNTRRV